MFLHPKRTLFFLSLFCLFAADLNAQKTYLNCDKDQLLIGGGRYYGGPRHSGSVGQIEYRWAYYFLRHIRPQVSFIVPEFKAFFFGLGLGLELYFGKYIVVTPNFEPGLYYRGSGRKLGHPVEFRSTIEAAFETPKKRRFGVQFYHISNAHLSHRNPGANALVFFIAIPTQKLHTIPRTHL